MSPSLSPGGTHTLRSGACTIFLEPARNEPGTMGNRAAAAANTGTRGREDPANSDPESEGPHAPATTFDTPWERAVAVARSAALGSMQEV